MRHREGIYPDGKEDGEELGGSEGGEMLTRVCYMEKNPLQSKEKNSILKTDLKKNDKATCLIFAVCKMCCESTVNTCFIFPDCKMHCGSTVTRQYSTTSVRMTDAKMNGLE